MAHCPHSDGFRSLAPESAFRHHRHSTSISLMAAMSPDLPMLQTVQMSSLMKTRKCTVKLPALTGFWARQTPLRCSFPKADIGFRHCSLACVIRSQQYGREVPPTDASRRCLNSRFDRGRRLVPLLLRPGLPELLRRSR